MQVPLKPKGMLLCNTFIIKIILYFIVRTLKQFILHDVVRQVRPRQVWGAREKKFPKKETEHGLKKLKKNKKKVNLSSPPWLAQGQAETKKVRPSVHHPSIHMGAVVGAGSIWPPRRPGQASMKGCSACRAGNYKNWNFLPYKQAGCHTLLAYLGRQLHWSILSSRGIMLYGQGITLSMWNLRDFVFEWDFSKLIIYLTNMCGSSPCNFHYAFSLCNFYFVVFIMHLHFVIFIMHFHYTIFIVHFHFAILSLYNFY